MEHERLRLSRRGTHKVGHDYLLLPRDLGGLVPQREAQV
jgi:hypothetical protein